jgi:hypothetical protein
MLRAIGRLFGFKSCFNNENPNIDGAFRDVDGWLFWPKATRYRIVERLGVYNKYHVKAFWNEEWVDVLQYDDGCDEEGQLEDARWRPMGDMVHYAVDGLERRVNRWLGKKEVETLVKEVKA